MIFKPMMVNLLGFKANVLDRGSNLSFGPVQQVDLFLSTKQNMGFGEENGDWSPAYVPFNLVFDQDVVDSPSIKNSLV
ncbi:MULTISPECIES: hypothetical protein [Paenibacillus]|uniref:Uncharacterized protein n=1 Tax=Paenibacillus naphthalenovorans TaxID=162209 RepID=A0A0U2M832_9BACL|nr:MULTISPECIES: hypothetical protein [Paenibacillus]ALS24432.1 hypothetical protein IJ22_41350 [Paenibacillus naphthalenovorans]